MKPHEEYAESIFNRIDKELKWIEKDYPIDLWRDKFELTKFIIEKQIDLINEVAVQSMAEVVVRKHKLLNKALKYLKNK